MSLRPTGCDAVPVIRRGPYCLPSSTASWNDWDAKKAVEAGFKSSVPVFSCIKKRYDAVSSIPWVVETLNGLTGGNLGF